jgi:hypothetical protein
VTVHWSPGGALPARPTAVAAVLAALTLACAASFAAPLAKADGSRNHHRPSAHSITPVTDRWRTETFDGKTHCDGPVRPP